MSENMPERAEFVKLLFKSDAKLRTSFFYDVSKENNQDIQRSAEIKKYMLEYCIGAVGIMGLGQYSLKTNRPVMGIVRSTQILRPANIEETMQDYRRFGEQVTDGNIEVDESYKGPVVEVGGKRIMYTKPGRLHHGVFNVITLHGPARDDLTELLLKLENDAAAIKTEDMQTAVHVDYNVFEAKKGVVRAAQLDPDGYLTSGQEYCPEALFEIGELEQKKSGRILFDPIDDQSFWLDGHYLGDALQE